MSKWIVGIFVCYFIFMWVGQVYFYDLSIKVGAILGVLLFIALGLFHITDKPKKIKKKNEG